MGRLGLRAPAGRRRPAAEAIRRRFAAIEVAVKNQDNREHDIFDSDDYLQDHGGMVAAVRALTGRPAQGLVRRLGRPGPAPGALARPRRRPGWCAPGSSTRSGSTAMQRHGYKGAFEMAATVDYLFGYDATAGVVEDWMYERVTEAYVADPARPEVLRELQPVGAAGHRRAAARGGRAGPVAARAPSGSRRSRSAMLEGEGWEEAR